MSLMRGADRNAVIPGFVDLRSTNKSTPSPLLKIHTEARAGSLRTIINPPNFPK
jgi:hypothetical protein